MGPKKYIVFVFILTLITSSLILSQENINSNIAKTIIAFFLISHTIIIYLVFKFNTTQNIFKEKLRITKESEKKHKNLHKKLLKQNTSLENKISVKAIQAHKKNYTSTLTGLPNRNKLLDESEIHDFAMMALLNIDNFKSFNDVYGEEMGNVMLKITSVFLQNKIENKGLYLYHVGGDEFAITATDNNNFDKNQFINMIETILQNYEDEDFIYRDQKLNLVISAGISFTGRKKMFAYADMALKDAKKRNLHITVFNDDKLLEKSHQDYMESHNKLLHALSNDDVISYFQPIVYIKYGSKPTKYESLVRIREDNGEIIQPLHFLDIAKTNRIYHKITKTVIINTLEVASKYKIPCSLNISLTDIDDELTMEMLFETLDSYSNNELLTIELLETEDFVDYDHVHQFCKKLNSYGVKIALDDFGSGYSNFAHILNLPIDYIKIDASLISKINQDKSSKIMVETIVELAHKLDIETIAEYVSSKEILDTVTEIGIDYAQGFYIGKPERIEDLISA